MRKRALIIATSVLCAIALGVLGAESWLRHSIREAIEQALGGVGAEVELGRVSVSLPLRQISVRDVRVRVHGNDIARRGYTVVSLEITLPMVTARSVRYDRVGEQLSLSAGRLSVDSPRATLVTRNVGSEGTTTPPEQDGSRPAHLAVRVDELAVTGAALELVRWLSDSEQTRTTLNGANFSARDITLDSLPAAIRFDSDSIVHTFGGGAKVLRGDFLALDVPGGAFSMASLSLVPQFDKTRFAEQSAGHEDWTSIRIGGIACLGVDFARLLSTAPALAIDSVSLASADIASYKNRKIHAPARTKALLHETIQRLPLPTEIGALSFQNLGITYEELAERGESPGTVTLTGGRGRAFNITNIATAGHDRVMTIDISSTLMHSGALEARFMLPVGPADDRWELSGRLGATDMEAFNDVVEPLMNVRITSGAIHSLDFHISATAARSHTRLTMAYNDFQVEFLRRRDHTRRRRFLTAIADNVLIRPDNPGRDGRGRLRTVESDTTRDPERSMWNYTWRSIEGAILKTVI